MATSNKQVDEKKLSEANVMYKTLCSHLTNRGWVYKKEEENLVVRTSAVGEDLSMKLYIKVDVNRSVMYLKSPMPFNTPSNRIDDMIKAVTIANWAMLNGMFEMDVADGYVGFKVVVPFMASLISEELCKYMIDMSCRMVDLFNDKFADLVEGKMNLAEFDDFTKKAFA